MEKRIEEGALLWEPSENVKKQSNIAAYTAWLKKTRGLDFQDYDSLLQWSITEIEDFWRSIWDYFGLQSSKPFTAVLRERRMPGAEWFPGAELNFTEHVFRNACADFPALIFRSEHSDGIEMSWEELRTKVASVAESLRAMGAGKGDRVIGYLPNIPETVIAFLAAASIGAVWSCCSPDFGTRSVIDRFKQIEPKVLFAVDGYTYGGRRFDRSAALEEIVSSLPTVVRTVLVPSPGGDEPRAKGPDRTVWAKIVSNPAAAPVFEQVPFGHPLWILYSSGTTGLPKPIVHGQGGILIELVKILGLHVDLKPGDRFFWFTTTGWMVWNFLLGGLLVGATPVLFDGNPGYPDLNVLWKMVAETGVKVFGTSAPFLKACRKAGLEPRRSFDLHALRAVGSTGSPLPPAEFQWVFDHVKRDLLLFSASGGTDVCTAFMAGCPLVPVRAGESSCRCLGVKVDAFDDDGNPVMGEVGELVVTEPMPSMPLFFWNDRDDQRYLESYFNMFPNVWRHGDWIKLTPGGGGIIVGRSDATLKRMGVRMGSSDFYAAIETLPEVADSLIVGFDLPGGRYYMPLFVMLQEGVELDDGIREKIKDRIRTSLSPRHLPDDIFAVSDIPKTLTGKKLEVPVKKILMGMPVEKSVNFGSMSNPQSMDYFIETAKRLNA
jgi:acetoacetyl-CoA synthetase